MLIAEPGHPQMEYGEALRQSIDNYWVFKKLLPRLKETFEGKWVLLHNQQMIGDPFDSWEEALDTGKTQFSNGRFSIQQIVEPGGDCGDGPRPDDLYGVDVRAT